MEVRIGSDFKDKTGKNAGAKEILFQSENMTVT